MLNGQEKLQSISFVVSILVIICLAITFSILFILYGRYKIKNINNGHEDTDVKKDIRKKYKKVIENNLHTVIKEEDAFKYVLYQDESTVKTYLLQNDLNNKKIVEAEEPISIYDSVNHKKDKNKVFEIISNILFGIFYGALAILIIVAITFKCTGQTLYFGNTSLLTVKTGSMEHINENNTYIKDNNLTDQIEQYSLIGINKVNREDELKLFDVCAYKYQDTIYVHRIVRIYNSDADNKTYYTFRGDANSSSASFELALTFDDIVGKYNGFQNFGLGLTLNYLQSNVGLIGLLSCLAFLLTYSITEGLIEKAYFERSLLVSKEIDSEIRINRK